MELTTPLSGSAIAINHSTIQHDDREQHTRSPAEIFQELWDALPKSQQTSELREILASTISAVESKASNQDETIDIDTLAAVKAIAASPSSPLQQGTTVAALVQANPHVAALPKYMLKDPATEISVAEIQVHTLGQALLYFGVPASALPALKNPHSFGIGFGIGVVSGAIIGGISTVRRGKSGEICKWLEHSAAVSSLYKAVIGGTQATGIVSNAIATFMTTNNDLFATCEGVLAGVIVGYEGCDALLNAIHQQTDSPAEVPSPSDSPIPESL